MTPITRKITAVAATTAAVVVLGPSALASAHAGEKTFVQTYPVASKLCGKVAAGTGPRRMRRPVIKAKVLADCAALEATFNAAHATVVAGDAAIASQLAAQSAATSAACAGTAAKSASCIGSEQAQVALTEQLNHQKHVLARAYFRTVEAARDHFWKAIRRLPGGRDLREDAPIPLLSD